MTIRVRKQKWSPAAISIHFDFSFVQKFGSSMRVNTRVELCAGRKTPVVEKKVTDMKHDAGEILRLRV